MSPASDIDLRLAARLHALRAMRCLTLDRLAEISAVSRAMLSRIERGESSPTAQLLARICGGLGISLADLFAADRAADPIARRETQPIWRDPASGYLRRTVSSAAGTTNVALAEVTLPPHADVAFDAMGLADAPQHVWVLEGRLEVGVGDRRHRLEAGDCLFMRFDAPARFANPAEHACRYAVVTSRREPAP